MLLKKGNTFKQIKEKRLQHPEHQKKYSVPKKVTGKPNSMLQVGVTKYSRRE